ncbi:hypothetical protein M440DRAFT_1406041 [Trichoderma longibrachiatum ATCC 18648]|uniref:Uncharacterized protein n=1 Tax=Trichoderma longibrachiatum ATCC 18648 TaxID=983965 RepID=A0A2T4BRP9_TRILO|nr:hypothetical protein M440DRAFT_1406041 [Trichoderma longibrachiatum ATCC 18648]
MAHYQPHPGAVELDTSNSSRYDGEIFEMPGDSAVPKAEREQQQQGRRPVHAQDEELGGMQANPWPFYLDQDVKTEASSRPGDGEESAVGARKDTDGKGGEETGKGVDGKAEQPPANPWAYFGPMSPSKDTGGHKAAAAGKDVGGLGITIEGSGDLKATGESQGAPAAAPAAHQSTPGQQGADGASHSSPAEPPSEPSSSTPPAAAFYPAPLRLSRKDVPPAVPSFKPYAPPTDSVPVVAPLNVKHRRHSAHGSQGEATTTLPYRPYRPAGHEVCDDDANSTADAAASSAPAMPPQPARSHGPPVTGAVAPQGTSPQVPTWSPSSGSPNPAQQQQPASTLTEASLDETASHHPSYQPSQLPPPAATGPSPPLPAAAPPIPPHPPFSPRPPAATAAVPPPPPPHPTEASVPAAPPHPFVPAPSPYPHTPHYTSPIQPVSPHNHHTSPSPSPQRPATGYPPSSSPVPGLQPYGQPHSAPTSALPSPAVVPFQFQATAPAQPQSLYPVPAPTPPVPSQTPPAPMSSPGPVSYNPPPQHFTPPPPTSSYDIPQPTYASSADIPPPQPPRPHYQQAAMGPYQYSPQPSPQFQPPYNDYAGTPGPAAQPPVSPQPSPYHSPHGPAIAPHQHHYPAQPTYAAAPNGNSPSSPDPQGQYAVPPLPPRPATTQPQLFAGFTSQNVVVFPPPPKRVFSPPPVAAGAAPPPPRRQSGGSSGRLFSSSSALKWIDKTGKGLENKLDAVLGSQGSSSKPPPQPPRPA